MARATNPEKPPGRGRRERVVGLVTRWPRQVLVVWVLSVLVLGGIGLGLEGKLSTQAIFVEGTDSEREHELVTREFGSDNALLVLLEGRAATIERQAQRLERRLDRLPRTLVISPWDQGGAIDGLRPQPDQVALLVSAGLRPGQGINELVPPVEREIDAVVAESVQVSIAGAPALIESFRDAAADAAVSGERIAIPALLIILLFVFRSVLAAAIPVVVGGAVVASTRGTLELLLGVVEIDAFALGAVGMMGLALGVDYSLLIVSRFREQIDAGEDVPQAVAKTVGATGRSVVPAGAGLVLAMLVSTQVLTGDMVLSVAIAISIATFFSVLSALVAVPAALMLLGSRLDRWTLPQRRSRERAAGSWQRRLSRRPGLVWPVVLILLVTAGMAFGLDTGVSNAALLPSDNPGREQQEEVQEALGPGWGSPMEIVMEGRGRPVTTASRLRALARFQRRVERDPGVDTMAGFTGIERETRKLSGLDGELAEQERGLARLDRGVERAEDGARANSSGLAQAADGAGQLGAAIGETHAGAGLLAQGARRASEGSEQLSGGLGRASEGTGELARGTGKASAGAGRLSNALAKAVKRSGEAIGKTRTLNGAMDDGIDALTELYQPVQETEGQLAAARQALERMGAGREDPEFAAALAAVNAASQHLTGSDPVSGEQLDPAYAGVRVGLEDAEGHFDLGNYLADRAAENGGEAKDGMEKLADASARLDRGLQRLAGASDKVSVAIGRLSEGGEALSPALRRLSEGTEQLAGGLGAVRVGAGDLASGLGLGAEQSELLTGGLRRIQLGLEREGDGSRLDRLQEESPGLFRSGFFYLAGLDGSRPEQRSQAGYLVNIDNGGRAARMLVIPSSDPASQEARDTTERIGADAAELARETGTEVVVGGVTPSFIDVDTALRENTPLTRIALCLVTFLILLPVVRSLTLPLIAALLNLLTLSATFGLLALLFDGSLLGGPGYVDTTVLPATVMVIFGLAIDYEVFLFARMREEYVRTGSPSAAIANGLDRTAHVITGAALIMIVVFTAFALSSFLTFRQFGTAQAIAVFIDAFLIRLIVLPVLMGALGKWSWWMPRWLDRLLPGGSTPVAAAGSAAR